MNYVVSIISNQFSEILAANVGTDLTDSKSINLIKAK